MKNSLNELRKSPDDLRTYLLKYRKKIPLKKLKQKFRKILSKLYEFPPFRQSKHILAYYGKTSTGEFDTVPLLKEILRNKQLYLPKSVKSSPILKLYHINHLDDQLSMGLYDIMEPIPSKCKEVNLKTIELVIVPGSVFDRTGGRYGFGAGYYDNLLADFQGIKLALALEDMIMDFSLELHEKDVKMNYIISENKIYQNPQQ